MSPVSRLINHALHAPPTAVDHADLDGSAAPNVVVYNTLCRNHLLAGRPRRGRAARPTSFALAVAPDGGFGTGLRHGLRWPAPSPLAPLSKRRKPSRRP